MIRFYSFLLFTLITTSVHAKRSTLVDLNINGICYDILSSTEVEVSSPRDNYYKDSLIIPETIVDKGGKEYAVVRIQKEACNYCENLKYVKLPATLREIGPFAFAYCSSLTEVVFPESLEKIEYFAFYQCGLTNVTIPEGLTKIEYEAFEENSNLKTVKLPNSITEIERQAFSKCYNLKQVNIPNSLKNIRDRTFYNCVCNHTKITDNN